MSSERKPFSFTYSQANKICGQYGLEMGEVTSEADYKSLRLHGRSKTTFAYPVDNGVQFWLGVNDIIREGEFLESDQITVMSYQTFFGNQPDNSAVKNLLFNLCVVFKDRRNDFFLYFT